MFTSLFGTTEKKMASMSSSDVPLLPIIEPIVPKDQINYANLFVEKVLNNQSIKFSGRYVWIIENGTLYFIEENGEKSSDIKSYSNSRSPEDITFYMRNGHTFEVTMDVNGIQMRETSRIRHTSFKNYEWL